MREPTLFNKIRIIQLNIAGAGMTHHIKGQGRHQVTLFPDVLDDFVTEDNPVRVIDIFVDDYSLMHLASSALMQNKPGGQNITPQLC